MSPETKRVMELARSEPQKLNHSYLGTEHLVLALSVTTGPSEMLEKLGVTPELLQRQVNTILGARQLLGP
jgi:ATP-dependent Clp protease ATP-binding subunit ClpA